MRIVRLVGALVVVGGCGRGASEAGAARDAGRPADAAADAATDARQATVVRRWPAPCRIVRQNAGGGPDDVTEISHDGDGRVVRERSSATGNLTTFAYDGGRLREERQVMGRMAIFHEYRYEQGRLAEEAEQNIPLDADGAADLPPDQLDALIDKQRPFAPPPAIVWKGTYDARGRLVRVETPHGDKPAVHRYQYDDAGRLTLMRYPDGTTRRYTYDASGRVVRSVYAPGQADWTFTYGDGPCRPQPALEDGEPPDPEPHTLDVSCPITYRDLEDGKLIERARLTYDAAGDLLRYEVIEGTHRPVVEAFTYDAAGNLRTHTAMLAKELSLESRTYDCWP